MPVRRSVGGAQPLVASDHALLIMLLLSPGARWVVHLYHSLHSWHSSFFAFGTPSRISPGAWTTSSSHYPATPSAGLPIRICSHRHIRSISQVIFAPLRASLSFRLAFAVSFLYLRRQVPLGPRHHAHYQLSVSFFLIPPTSSDVATTHLIYGTVVFESRETKLHTASSGFISLSYLSRISIPLPICVDPSPYLRLGFLPSPSAVYIQARYLMYLPTDLSTVSFSVLCFDIFLVCNPSALGRKRTSKAPCAHIRLFEWNLEFLEADLPKADAHH